jgi:hypothetical protein
VRVCLCVCAHVCVCARARAWRGVVLLRLYVFMSISQLPPTVNETTKIQARNNQQQHKTTLCIHALLKGHPLKGAPQLPSHLLGVEMPVGHGHAAFAFRATHFAHPRSAPARPCPCPCPCPCLYSAECSSPSCGNLTS